MPPGIGYGKGRKAPKKATPPAKKKTSGSRSSKKR
jgi:hypothetical protein